MTQNTCIAALLAVIAVALLPAAAAQAQWYSPGSRQPPPLYPYAVQADKPRAVDAAPNASVSRRPATARLHRPHRKTERKLIEELRQRNKIQTTAIDTRRHVDDKKAAAKRGKVADSARRQSGNDGKQRVIAADAEITILGPDRMSIRLFRKAGGSKPGGNKPKASAE
jgi:hypothetical protein